ncbi:MAG: NAD(P)H-quinone oxidoreductase subunit 4, partial [Chthoniobacterales bacterium]
MAHLIAGLIYLPILAALFVSVAPRNYGRAIALASNLLTALCALELWRHFDPALPGLQMVFRHEWIPAIGA